MNHLKEKHLVRFSIKIKINKIKGKLSKSLIGSWIGSLIGKLKSAHKTNRQMQQTKKFKKRTNKHTKNWETKKRRKVKKQKKTQVFQIWIHIRADKHCRRHNRHRVLILSQCLVDWICQTASVALVTNWATSWYYFLQFYILPSGWATLTNALIPYLATRWHHLHLANMWCHLN